MKIEAINLEPENELITLIFGGFGFKASAYEFKNAYLVSDYSDFTPCDFSFLVGKKLRLIAYSMGVMVASRCDLSALKFEQKIAIAGSCEGIDDELGIAHSAFKASVRALKADAFAKACGDESLIKHLRDDLKPELISLQEIAKMPILWDDFDLAVLAKNDQIFKYENLLRAWANTKIMSLESTHFCVNLV